MPRSLLLPRLTLAFAALAAASTVQAAGPGGTVSGTFTMKGTTHKPTYVYAFAKPDSFDKTKESIEVLFTTKPVPETELTGSMPGEGSRLQASLSAEGRFEGVVFFLEGGSMSASGTGLSFDKKVLDGTKVAGRLYTTEEVGTENFRGRFDLTFEAPIFRPKKAVPASASDKAAAAKSPQAKAYAAYLSAVHAGDEAALKRIVTSELVRMMAGPDFKENLKFLKEMTPKSVDYLRVTESGDTATLEVQTKTDTGAVSCTREGGAWKIGQQKWTNKK